MGPNHAMSKSRDVTVQVYSVDNVLLTWYARTVERLDKGMKRPVWFLRL